MDANCPLSDPPTKWREVVYGRMQPGYDDNHTDETLLEAMVMDANVVKRDIWKIQEYKFEIKGPWDETKLFFEITD